MPFAWEGFDPGQGELVYCRKVKGAAFGPDWPQMTSFLLFFGAFATLVAGGPLLLGTVSPHLVNMTVALDITDVA